MRLRSSARGRAGTVFHSVASERENQEVIDAELSQGKFSFIYRGSKQLYIKVKHFVPFFTSRTICEFGVHTLPSAFDVDESGHVGYSYAAGMKVVVSIPEQKLQVVESYLRETGLDWLDANELAFKQGIQWYGIVDGVHTHRSLTELERGRPDHFHDFKWTVTVVKWQPITVLKAFSRARNVLQTANTVDMTLYDTIAGLHEIALHKANLAGDAFNCFVRKQGVITEIADEYCGCTRYSNNDSNLDW